MDMEGQRTGNVPLRAVLGPQANAVVVAGDADVLVDFYETSAEVLTTLGNLGIRGPGVLVLPILGRGIPSSVTQAPCVGALLRSLLEQVVDGLNGGVKGGQQRAVAEAPMPVDGTAAFLLRTRDRQTVRGAWRRRGGQLLNICGGVSCGSHIRVNSRVL